MSTESFFPVTEKSESPVFICNVAAIWYAKTEGLQSEETLTVIDGESFEQGSIYSGDPGSVFKKIDRNYWENVDLLLDRYGVEERIKKPAPEKGKETADTPKRSEEGMTYTRVIEYPLPDTQLLIREKWEQFVPHTKGVESSGTKITYRLTLDNQSPEFMPKDIQD